MKEFEAGKSYKVNAPGDKVITVVKRTKHYATIEGAYTGRFYIYRDNFFGMGEELCLPLTKNSHYFCFAGKEI